MDYSISEWIRSNPASATDEWTSETSAGFSSLPNRFDACGTFSYGTELLPFPRTGENQNSISLWAKTTESDLTSIESQLIRIKSVSKIIVSRLIRMIHPQLYAQGQIRTSACFQQYPSFLLLTRIPIPIVSIWKSVFYLSGRRGVHPTILGSRAY